MKKHNLLVILAVLLVLTLAACGGCKHEWQQASCEMAKTCTLCGETEGQALGHNWQEASCEAPETCSRCDAVQGEVLSHTFTKWETMGEEMIRYCTTCEMAETAQTDHNILLSQILQGEWIKRTLDAHSSEESISTICFQEDGTYVLQKEQTLTGTWELVTAEPSNYTITLHCNEEMAQTEETEEETSYAYTIEYLGENDALRMTGENIGGHGVCFFIRNDEKTRTEILEHIVGTWTSELTGVTTPQEKRTVETGYTVTAHENGEIIISMDEEFTGGWIYDAKTIENLGTQWESTIYFYTITGENSEHFTEMVVQNGRLTVGQMKGNDYHYCLFGKKTAQEQEQFIKGPELLPGTWKSTLVEKYDNQTDTPEVLEEEYILNVNTDGTYSSNIPYIDNGNWMYDDYDSEQGYMYYLMPNNFDNYVYGASIRDGKLDTVFMDDNDFVCIYMENNIS